ncbi:outer membrane protein assembly factor BamE [Oleiagrimonas sp. C23AA]|uniref:outer membrane protein assembly factor BamE n=1 Tax=Oleiagrimonas sp. C23AA TaxID=2719047 RepID=UPI0031B6CDAB
MYKPPVQQGNFLKKEKVDQLKPGMTKRQVLVLLGTPSIASPFDHDRWDYVSSYTPRSGKTTLRTFTLYFDNDVLARTEGNFFNEDPTKLLNQAKKLKTDYNVDDESGDKGPATKDDTPVLGPNKKAPPASGGQQGG